MTQSHQFVFLAANPGANFYRANFAKLGEPITRTSQQGGPGLYDSILILSKYMSYVCVVVVTLSFATRVSSLSLLVHYLYHIF